MLNVFPEFIELVHVTGLCYGNLTLQTRHRPSPNYPPNKFLHHERRGACGSSSADFFNRCSSSTGTRVLAASKRSISSALANSWPACCWLWCAPVTLSDCCCCRENLDCWFIH